MPLKFLKGLFRKSPVETVTDGVKTVVKASANAARRLSKKDHPIWKAISNGEMNWPKAVLLIVVVIAILLMQIL